MTMRTKLLTGGLVLAVAGVATLSVMSFTALRHEVNRTSDVVYWTAVKDSTDAALVATYLERYPDGMFAKLALTRMDELKKNYPRATLIFHRGRKEKEDSRFVADMFLTTEEANEIASEYKLDVQKIKDSDDYERV